MKVRKTFIGFDAQTSSLLKKTRNFFLSALLVLSNMASSDAYAIEGGEERLQAKLVVPLAITTAPGKTSTCSGVALTSKIVATAAHCVFDRNEKISSSIKVGNPGSSYKFTEANLQTWSPATEVIVHPSFSSARPPGDNFDIAFLKLTNELTNVTHIEVMQKSDISTISRGQYNLRVFGYGQTDMNRNWPEFPRELSGTLKRNYNENEFLFESNSGRICGGDSGGPVYFHEDNKYILIGLVSRSGDGDPCGTYDFVSTIVSPYLYLAEALGYTLKSQNIDQIENYNSTLIETYDLYYEIQDKYSSLPVQLRKLHIRNNIWNNFKAIAKRLQSVEEQSFDENSESEVIDEAIEILVQIQDEIFQFSERWDAKFANKYCINSKMLFQSIMRNGKCQKGFKSLQ